MAHESSRRGFATPRRLPLVSAVVLLLAAGLLAGLAIGQSASPRPARHASVSGADAARPFQPDWALNPTEHVESPTKPATQVLVAAKPPSRMRIPSIGVDAASESLPFLGVPANPNNVGWFNTLSAPGESGDAVFDGHLDWTSGPAVFWNLAKLKVGDDIYVEGGANTKPLHFKIDNMLSVHYLSTPPDWLYSTQGPPQLSLITCDGGWNPRLHVYEQRLLVHSNLVRDEA